MEMIYPHTLAVLFTSLPSVEQVRNCFTPESIRGRSERDGKPAAYNMLQGEGFAVRWNEATEEQVEVDLQPVPWPDDHGAKSGDAPTIVAATVGALGRKAAPGGLERACQHAYHWKEAQVAVAGHSAFIALRMCGQMFNPAGTALSGAAEQLGWMIEAAGRLMNLPGAVAFFNPAAEILQPPDRLAHCISQPMELLPYMEALLSSRRWIVEGWDFFDTTGMQQLGLPDMELAVPADTVRPSECFVLLINLCIHLVHKGDVFLTGHTVDGLKGERWRVMRCAKSVAGPQRAVIRWWPESLTTPPPALAPQEVLMPDPAGQAEEGEETDPSAAMGAAVAGAIQDWQHRLAVYRPLIEEFLHTEDALAMVAVGAGSTRDRDIQQAMSGGMIIPVFPVIGSLDNTLPVRPSLTAGTFDSRPEAILHAAWLAGYLGQLYGAGPQSDPVAKALQRIVEDDRYVAKKRVRIPEPAANGYEIYAFCTLLRRDEPDEGNGIKTVYTAPGSKPAMILHIPSSLMHGRQPPALDLEQKPSRTKPDSPPPLPGAKPASGCGASFNRIGTGVLLIVGAMIVFRGVIPSPTLRKIHAPKLRLPRHYQAKVLPSG